MTGRAGETNSGRRIGQGRSPQAQLGDITDVVAASVTSGSVRNFVC